MAGKRAKKQAVAAGDGNAFAVIDGVEIAGRQIKKMRRGKYNDANVATGDGVADADVDDAEVATADNIAASDNVKDNAIGTAGHGVAGAKELINVIDREENAICSTSEDVAAAEQAGKADVVSAFTSDARGTVSFTLIYGKIG